MGPYLGTPNKDKVSCNDSSDGISYGATSMQGWRKSNEDAHIHDLNLGDGNSLFCVFDGHGGE